MKTKTCKVCKTDQPEDQFRPKTRKTCNTCEAKRRNAEYWANRDAALEKAKQYREVNKEAIAARKAKYQQTPEGHRNMLEASRKYYRTAKGWKQKNEYSKAWGKTEKGVLSGRIRCSRRRARMAKAGGTFTASDWTAQIQQQNNLCYYCGKPFTTTAPATIDHVIPISKGGRHSPENIVAACRSCNSKKYTNPAPPAGDPAASAAASLSPAPCLTRSAAVARRAKWQKTCSAKRY